MLTRAITLHNVCVFAEVAVWNQLAMILVFLENKKLLLQYFVEFQ